MCRSCHFDACRQPTRPLVIERPPQRFGRAPRRVATRLDNGVDDRVVGCCTVNGNQHAHDVLGLDRRGRCLREGGLVHQDRSFHLAQLTARLQTELLDQRLASSLIRRERVRLATSAIQRKHELTSKTLTVRVARHERLQLGEQLHVPTERELDVDPVFERPRPCLLEPRHLEARPGFVGQIRQRRLPPARERLAEEHGRAGDAPLGPQRASEADQPLEPEEVDLLGIDGEQVTGRLGQQHRRLGTRAAIGLQHLTQVRHVHLQRRRRMLRGIVPPQAIDQPLGRHRTVRLEQQHREHRPLLGTAERDPQTLVERFHHPEHSELHHTLPDLS